ncbi:MAG: GntR family transcriptional regulator [Pseudomonadota bacterium]
MTDAAVRTRKSSAADTADTSQTAPGDLRRNLHQATADLIRDLILDGTLSAGARISEKAMCDRFDVSRTPVREALKALATEGLVTIRPNAGARVTEISDEDVAATFPVMGALEALAGELAAKAMTDDEIAYVAERHAEMVRHYGKRALGPYFRANQQIHEAILAGARNPVLTEQYRQLAARMRLARYRANMSDARWSEAVAEHEQMLVALQKRQPKRLARTLRTHLDNKEAVVREAIGQRR